MLKSKQIPTIEPSILDEFHFGKIQWNWHFSKEHHLFHINRIEDFRDKLSFPLPPHRKTIYDLIFLTKGSSVRNKGLNQYHIGKNQFFFLPALQITSHESMSENAQGFYLHFSPEIFSDNAHFLKQFSFLGFLANPVITIPGDMVTPVVNIFQRLENLYIGLKKDDLKLVVWYLLALLTEVNRFVVNGETEIRKTSSSLLTERYKNALTQHIYEKQTVKEYADILYVSPNHLNKCVKMTLNKTAQSLLNEMTMLEAKSLLKYSDLSISEIAEKLRSSTPSNFARFFKNQTGTSPKQYAEL